MKKTLSALLCSAAILFVPSVFAINGQVQGNLSVLLTIGSGCSVTGATGGSGNNFGTLNFGNHALLNNIILSQSAGTSGSMQLTCSAETLYSIGLDNGVNATGSQRQMSNGAGANITYNLYQDTALLLPWNNTTGIFNGVGTGLAVPFIVYGLVPVQSTPIAGNYTDTVVVTITW